MSKRTTRTTAGLHALALLGAMLLAMAPLGAVRAVLAQATPTCTITFETDSSGSKPNGFTSAACPVAHFSDSMGTGLNLGNFTPSTHGRGLAVFGDHASFLIIDFDVLMGSITLGFGNDDPIRA
jgi:hypothetical protein